MTIEQHQELGARLLRLRVELDSIGETLGQYFPVAIGDRWAKASTRLLDIRSPLENDLIRVQVERGVDDGKVPKCYYGVVDQ